MAVPLKTRVKDNELFPITKKKKKKQKVENVAEITNN